MNRYYSSGVSSFVLLRFFSCCCASNLFISASCNCLFVTFVMCNQSKQHPKFQHRLKRIKRTPCALRPVFATSAVRVRTMYHHQKSNISSLLSSMDTAPTSSPFRSLVLIAITPYHHVSGWEVIHWGTFTINRLHKHTVISPVSGTTTSETIRLTTFESDESSLSSLSSFFDFSIFRFNGIAYQNSRIPRTPFAVRPIARTSVSAKRIAFLRSRTT